MQKLIFNDTRHDIERATANGCPFIFVWGGRGHGKTYPTLRWVIEEKKRFVFVKRTAVDIELLISGKDDTDINPFIALNRDMGWSIHPFKFSKSFGGFWEGEKDDAGELHPVGEMLGYILPLSTVSKVKGFNIEADVVIFDEFIPQIGERIMKGEGDAFWNLLETVGRNREMLGKEPLIVICLANATLLNNPIFSSAGLIGDVEAMIKKGKEIRILKDRGVYLHRLPDSDEFTDRKRQTALYKMLKGTQFSKMALDNEFAYEDFGLIEYQSLKGFKPLFNINYNGAIYGVWLKPSTGVVYMCGASDKWVTTYNVGEEQDRISCRMQINKYWTKYLKGRFKFETFEIKQVFLFILK